jgi:myo-inositol-1(or 4)-monophosphatase
MDLSEPVDVARQVAEAGGQRAASLFREELTVETKGGKTDVVTRADREAEREIVDRIREHDASATIVAEESAADTAIPETGRAWIVDPIDGTNNYVRGIPLWVTAVAVVEDGRPVAAAIEAPELGRTFSATPEAALVDGEPMSISESRDPEAMAVGPTYWWPMDRREEYGAAADAIVERFGDLIRLRSAQLTLAFVASGAIDATLTNRRMNPWDSVAGVLMVRAAGGTVTDVEGEQWAHDSQGLVASDGGAHEEVLSAAQAIESVR